jgi:predicted NUDIX family NTP pyrophosphohydrolase
VRQKSGKQVHAWAFEGDCDPALVKSNDFELEWPPRSGRICSFPEIDRAAFFALPEARRRINPAQVPLLDRLEAAARRAD